MSVLLLAEIESRGVNNMCVGSTGVVQNCEYPTEEHLQTSQES